MARQDDGPPRGTPLPGQRSQTRGLYLRGQRVADGVARTYTGEELEGHARASLPSVAASRAFALALEAAQAAGRELPGAGTGADAARPQSWRREWQRSPGAAEQVQAQLEALQAENLQWPWKKTLVLAKARGSTRSGSVLHSRPPPTGHNRAPRPDPGAQDSPNSERRQSTQANHRRVLG